MAQQHTPEMLDLLRNNHEGDLSRWYVYGSTLRPVWKATICARIPNAICLQRDKAATGFHTYVILPERLERHLQDRYGLVLVSQPDAPISIVYRVWTNDEPREDRFPLTTWTRLGEDEGWMLWRVETTNGDIEDLFDCNIVVMAYEPQK